MRFELTSSQECTIDGVGLLEPGKTVVVDESGFRFAHGYSIAEANFPDHVTLVAVTEEVDEAPTDEDSSE